MLSFFNTFQFSDSISRHFRQPRVRFTYNISPKGQMRLNETHLWLAKMLSKVLKTKPRHNRLMDCFCCLIYFLFQLFELLFLFFDDKFTKYVHNQTKRIKEIFCKRKKMCQYITEFCFIRNQAYMVLLQRKCTSMFIDIKNVLLQNDNFILLSVVYDLLQCYDTLTCSLADNLRHPSFKTQQTNFVVQSQ